MRALESTVEKTQLRWVPAVWALIGAELLMALWFHAARVPVEVSLDGYLWHFGILLGVEDRSVGVLRILNLVNTMVVVGLWLGTRRSRGAERRWALATGLGAALVFVAIGWWSVRLTEQFRPIEAEAVYRMEPGGEYRIDVVGDR